MEYDLKIRDLKLEEKQKELDQVLKERDDFKVKLEKWSNASVLQNEVLNKQRYLSDKSCIGFGVESSSSMESDNSSGNTNSTESFYPNFQKTKGFHSVPPPTGQSRERLKDYAIMTVMLWKYDRKTQGLSCLFLMNSRVVMWHFGNDYKGGRISGKGTIARTSCLDFGGKLLCGGVKKGVVQFFKFVDEVLAIWSRGLPSTDNSKLDHSCLACRKGKQHRASCKKIKARTVREPLELLHMDLFRPVSVESVNRKKVYCLVGTDDVKHKLRHKLITSGVTIGNRVQESFNENEFCAKKGIIE
ncbi:hypothetical protein Tco_0001831 [Tanacetum coccineum]